jgi:hypothetical protein
MICKGRVDICKLFSGHFWLARRLLVEPAPEPMDCAANTWLLTEPVHDLNDPPKFQIIEFNLRYCAKYFDRF